MSSEDLAALVARLPTVGDACWRKSDKREFWLKRVFTVEGVCCVLVVARDADPNTPQPLDELAMRAPVFLENFVTAEGGADTTSALQREA